MARKDLKDVITLPFVKDIGKGKGKVRTFWNVEPTGDYLTDTNTGLKYGMLALEYMKERDLAPLLGWCVCDMMRSFDDKNKGIEIGFLSFSQVPQWGVVLVQESDTRPNRNCMRRHSAC